MEKKSKTFTPKDDESESWSSGEKEQQNEPEEEVPKKEKKQKKPKVEVAVEEEEPERAEEEETKSLPNEWLGWKSTIRKTVKYSPDHSLSKKKLLKHLKRVYQRHLEKKGGEYDFSSFKAKVNEKVSCK